MAELRTVEARLRYETATLLAAVRYFSVGSRAVVAVGATGHGKSSTLNTLCGVNHFETSTGLMGLQSCTKTTQSISLLMEGGENLVVIDTPGLMDTDRVQQQGKLGYESTVVIKEGSSFLEELHKAFVIAGEEIHAFLLVVNLSQRWSVEMTAVIELLKKMGFPWSNTILVVTHGRQVHTNPNQRKSELLSLLANEACPQQLKELMRQIDNRVLIIDNTEDSLEQCAAFVREFVALLHCIRLPYRNDLFLQAEEGYALHCEEVLADICTNKALIKISREALPKYWDLREMGLELVEAHKKLISTLERIAEILDDRTISDPKVIKARIAGMVTTIAGLGATLIGVGFTPVTAGGSLAFVAAGGALLAAGTATSGLAPVVKFIKQKVEMRTAEKHLANDQKLAHSFYELYGTIRSHVEQVIENNGRTSVDAVLARMICGENRKDAKQMIKSLQLLRVFQQVRARARGENNVDADMLRANGLFSLPTGFNQLESQLDVACVAANAVILGDITRVSGGSMLHKTCIETLEKESRTIRYVCS